MTCFPVVVVDIVVVDDVFPDVDKYKIWAGRPRGPGVQSGRTGGRFWGNPQVFLAFLFSSFSFHLPCFLSCGSCVFHCFHVFSLFLGFSFMTLWHLLLAALPRFQTLAETIFKKTVSIIWVDWYAQKDPWAWIRMRRLYMKKTSWE